MWVVGREWGKGGVGKKEVFLLCVNFRFCLWEWGNLIRTPKKRAMREKESQWNLLNTSRSKSPLSVDLSRAYTHSCPSES